MVTPIRAGIAQIFFDPYSNEDIGEDVPPHEGWYVEVEVDGRAYPIGPDEFENGFKTIDDALAATTRWAQQRGLKISSPILEVAIIKEGDQNE